MSTYQNTIRSLTERVLRLGNLGAVPRDSRFNLRDVEYMIRDCFGKAILASWSEGRKSRESMDVSDAFITTLTKQVFQTLRKECYIELDFDWVDIPDGSGIQSVRPSADSVSPISLLTNNMSAFIPVSARFDDIFRNLPAQSMEGQIVWKQRQKKIFFGEIYGQNLLDLGIPYVDVDAISVSEGCVGQDKPISIPQNIADAIVKETAAFFMPLMQPQKDLLNDNSPNPKPLKS